MSDSKKGFIEFSEEELARGVAHSLKPFIDEQVQLILSQKAEDDTKPLTMAEAANWLGLSRSCFSGLVGKGEIRFKALNPDNPKSTKYFTIKDLRKWLETNKTKAISELKNSANG